ncbi:hypothetical protein N7501_011483 [Penicillium viridicatum]|nr:hypothetical protein N7501_011483 [Penicillium viridicatum]
MDGGGVVPSVLFLVEIVSSVAEPNLLRRRQQARARGLSADGVLESGLPGFHLVATFTACVGLILEQLGDVGDSLFDTLGDGTRGSSI